MCPAWELIFTLHELVLGFFLSCRAVVVKNTQLPKKTVFVLVESRRMEGADIVISCDQRIHSDDEVHKHMLFGTVESSIIEMSHPKEAFNRVPFAQMFLGAGVGSDGEREAFQRGRNAYVALLELMIKFELAMSSTIWRIRA